MKVYKNFTLEHKVLVVDGFKRDDMQIVIETVEGKTIIPIFPPIRANNSKRTDPIDKLEQWTKKELSEILENEIKKKKITII